MEANTKTLTGLGPCTGMILVGHEKLFLNDRNVSDYVSKLKNEVEIHEDFSDYI